MAHVHTIFAGVCCALALAGCVYFAMSLWAARRFLRDSSQQPATRFAPPVSILRSLKGVDAQMYSAFRSHCLLDYDEYEVVFGATDPDEPALKLVQKLQEEFPLRQIRVIYCPERLGPNGKVSNLAQMLRQAKYEHVVINDSDIVVPRNYLSGAITPLAQAGVGMVTTLYRASGGTTLGSKLEALGLSTDFAGGVLVARALEGVRFGLGATIATTKSVLREIGGLEPLADYLGDDYELGARTAAAGYRVELAGLVVETALPDYSFREFWAHQLRWARNIKDRRRGQYFGLIVTFALVWAIVAVVALPGSWWTWSTLALTTLLRLAAALAVGKGVLHDPRILRDLWLLPLRDATALVIWFVSFCGNTVEWRGMRFRLKEGKLKSV